MAADPDLFNRWEAGQSLARDLMLARVKGTPDTAGERRFVDALGRAMADQSSEPAFKALLLALPSEQDLALAAPPADPAAIHEARDNLRQLAAEVLRGQLEALHDGLVALGAFSPDAESAGRRALRNAALDILMAAGTPSDIARAKAHADAASDMTSALGGLSALMQAGGAAYDSAIAAFYTRWRDEPLVIDKWFALQARSPAPDALDKVKALTEHPAFDAKTPNRFRALVSTFAQMNPARFHDPSGAGYRFLADQILAVDRFNPQVAARQLEPLGGWRRYKPELATLMKAELARILASPDLSANVAELAAKALAE